MDDEDAKNALNILLDMELSKILNGSLISEIQSTLNLFSDENAYPKKDMMEHLSIYSFNLVSICTALLKELPLPQLNQNPYGLEEKTKSAWNQLRHLWRYSFSNEDMERISNMIAVETSGDTKVLHCDKLQKKKIEKNPLEGLLDVYQALDEEIPYATLGALLGIPTRQIHSILRTNGLNRVAWAKLRCIINDGRFRHGHLPFDLYEVIDESLKEKDVGTLLCAVLIVEKQLENNDKQKLMNTPLTAPEFWLYLCDELRYPGWRLRKDPALQYIYSTVFSILYYLIKPTLKDKERLLRKFLDSIMRQRELINEGPAFVKLLRKMIQVSNWETEVSEWSMIQDLLRAISHETLNEYHYKIRRDRGISAEMEAHLLELFHTFYICKQAGFLMPEEIHYLIEYYISSNFKNSKFMIEILSYMLHIVVDSELFNGKISMLLLQFIHENRVSAVDIYRQDNTAALDLCKLMVDIDSDFIPRDMTNIFIDLVYFERDRLSLQLLNQIKRLAITHGDKMLQNAVEEVFNTV